ncbi:hypothetical protein Tco_0558293 [Tanacetum coccineum]
MSESASYYLSDLCRLINLLDFYGYPVDTSLIHNRISHVDYQELVDVAHDKDFILHLLAPICRHSSPLPHSSLSYSKVIGCGREFELWNCSMIKVICHVEERGLNCCEQTSLATDVSDVSLISSNLRWMDSTINLVLLLKTGFPFD